MVKEHNFLAQLSIIAWNADMKMPVHSTLLHLMYRKYLPKLVYSLCIVQLVSICSQKAHIIGTLEQKVLPVTRKKRAHLSPYLLVQVVVYWCKVIKTRLYLPLDNICKMFSTVSLDRTYKQP